MKLLQAISAIGVTAVLSICLNSSAYSQKMANVQENSVWAPANIKVDAKLNDWNDALQANNKTTDIYYTIANDSKNLYLVIKSTDQMIDNKIIAGGINFTINTTGKKKEKDAYIITFPLVDIVNLRSQVMQSMNGQRREMDSATIARMRTQAVKAAKEIKLVGFKDIPDSVLSVYNEYGLKAALDYDSKGNMILEMSVPLKYISLDNSKEFAYNIKLNGLNINALFPGAGAMFAGAAPGGGFGGGGFGGGGGGNGGFGGGNGGGRPPAGMPSMQDMQNIISPTDFWGKYTLAKK